MKFNLRDYLDYYLYEIMPYYAQESYLDKCKWVVDIVLKPNIEDNPLLEFLKSDDLNKLLKKCSKLCKSAAPSARQFLAISFNYAYKERYITEDIMKDVDKYNFETPDIISYSNEDIKKLIICVEKYGDKNLYCEFLLALFAGLRVSEIRGLMWQDIDFSKNTITIARQIVGRTPKVTPPKTANSYRTIKVADIVMEELKNRKSVNNQRYREKKNINFKKYVSVSASGNIKNDSTYSAGLRRICTGNNLPNLSFGDLRHLFANIMIDGMKKEIPPEIYLKNLSNMLGHKNIGTTLELYIGNENSFEKLRSHISNELDPLKAGEEDVYR